METETVQKSNEKEGSILLGVECTPKRRRDLLEKLGEIGKVFECDSEEELQTGMECARSEVAFGDKSTLILVFGGVTSSRLDPVHWMTSRSSRTDLQNLRGLLHENVQNVESPIEPHETLCNPSLRCDVCGKTNAELDDGKAIKKCGECLKALYCSISCQRKVYKEHKNQCKLSNSCK